MASLRTKKTRTGTSYIVCFRFGGKLYNRSLGEVPRGEAESRRKRVEATIHDIGTGRLTMPSEADAGLFILSDGKLAEKPKAAVLDEQITLQTLWEQYRDELPEGAKEPSSQKTEALHVKHLMKVLKESTEVKSLTVADLQRYIAGGSGGCWRRASGTSSGVGTSSGTPSPAFSPPKVSTSGTSMEHWATRPRR